MTPYDFDTVVTRGGDDGRTSLFSGERLFKDAPAVQVLGDIDELSSLLGVVKVEVPTTAASELHGVQLDLHRIMSIVATTPGTTEYSAVPALGADRVEHIETLLAALLSATTIAPEFVVPGSNRPSAYADLARAVTRRCERALVGLIRTSGRTDLSETQRYLNRLSDYLFVLARALAS